MINILDKFYKMVGLIFIIKVGLRWLENLKLREEPLVFKLLVYTKW